MIDCFNDFVVHIQAMCYSPVICTLYRLWRCRRNCKTIQMKAIKYRKRKAPVTKTVNLTNNL